MPGNSNLHDSSRNKQDEFYTNLQLIEDELKHYRAHFNRPVSRNSDAFAYNTRGEVASATVDACSAAYAYDGIGNLLETSVATGGLPAVATSYYANSLNQYESIWSADSDAWLEHSENGEMTRFGDHGFRYDAKSRLVCTGVCVFDEERYLAGDYGDYNDLYSFEPVVSNRYDYLDRRVQKVTPEATHTYFYDGWMLIKEVVANTNGATDVIEYHWGKDLSGTIGGAGGIGGLLYISVSNSSTPNSSTHQLYIPWYDAYGNIMGYWDAQGNVVAEYTYDAFGKLVSSSGPMADVFAIRYSTKYFDSETGLYYYGYRYYSPELMRWITRDPIGEEGGVNIYCFSGNTPINKFDPTGLTWKIDRKGGLFAFAVSQSSGDSFAALAKLLQLDMTDYRKWAHTTDASPIKCKKYRVPNLIVYDNGRRKFRDHLPLNIISVWQRKNEARATADRASGFMVQFRTDVSSDQIETALKTDGLYRYTFSGHGDGETGINSYPDPFDTVDPVLRYTKYGINALTLQACGSAAVDVLGDYRAKGLVRRNNWECNVATVGYFIGYDGSVNLLNEVFQWTVVRGTNNGR